MIDKVIEIEKLVCINSEIALEGYDIYNSMVDSGDSLFFILSFVPLSWLCVDRRCAVSYFQTGREYNLIISYGAFFFVDKHVRGHNGHLL